MPVFDTPVRTDDRSLKKVLGQKQPAILVLVDGSRTDKALDDALERAARQHAGDLLVIRVDGTENPETMAKYNPERKRFVRPMSAITSHTCLMMHHCRKRKHSLNHKSPPEKILLLCPIRTSSVKCSRAKSRYWLISGHPGAGRATASPLMWSRWRASMPGGLKWLSSTRMPTSGLPVSITSVPSRPLLCFRAGNRLRASPVPAHRESSRLLLRCLCPNKHGQQQPGSQLQSVSHPQSLATV
jgi:hypothetical protein